MSPIHKFYVHSTRGFNNFEEGIVVKEKLAIPQEDGTYKFEDSLSTIKNPKRSFYIHQKKYQDYQYKIEYARIDQCDKYTCYNRELEQEIKNRVGIYSNKRMSLRELCNSPYLYGADIDIEVLIKIAYMNKVKGVDITPKYSFGALDLEVSVVESDGRIMLASICIDNIIHLVVLDAFLYKPGPIDETGYPKRIKATLTEIDELAPIMIGDYLEKFNLSYKLYLVHNEMELITKMMKLVHDSKIDFLGIWNMPYDVPKIIERIRYNNGRAEDILCHPDVPKEFRVAKYRPDFGKTDHFTDSWDWMNLSGYTQPIDCMRLYSRLRKVKGREPSYTLGAISEKVIKHGKVDLGGSHWYNQLYNFIAYSVYCMVDAGNVYVMDSKTNDTSSMCSLVGNSLLKSFSKQTVMLKNDFYQYCLERDLISGTVGEIMGTPYDDLIGKAGGTVLSPYLIRNAGLRCVAMRKQLHTLLYMFIKDIDAASMYPFTTKAFNISKETCRATMVRLTDMADTDIEDLYVTMMSPTENALLYGNKFFNIPTPSQLLDNYEKWFVSRQNMSPREIRASVGLN